jgi:hypothetical protein
MMEKELLVAVMAYHLVRAIMLQAAQRAKIDPRQLSIYHLCPPYRARWLSQALAAPTTQQQQQELERLIALVARRRLPQRTKRRSYRARCGVGAIVFLSAKGEKLSDIAQECVTSGNHNRFANGSTKLAK